ncbi:MAG: DUF5058 family protein [Pyramidobacter sp.]|jgi:hypothetical protein
MEDLMKIANALPFWGCALISVGIVVLLAVRYTVLAVKFAPSVGLDRATCSQAFRSGLISAFGPAVAQVIVILAMLAVIGGPISWIRLSMIGSAATELTAARTGAAACGVELGGPGYGLNEMAVSWFTMCVNGCGWLVMVFLFTHRLDEVGTKLGGSDMTWRALITATASIGLYSHMVSPYLVKFSARTVAAVAGAASMYVFILLGRKYTWIKNYSLGFAIIVGLIIGSFFM